MYRLLYLNAGKVAFCYHGGGVGAVMFSWKGGGGGKSYAHIAPALTKSI